MLLYTAPLWAAWVMICRGFCLERQDREKKLLHRVHTEKNSMDQGIAEYVFQNSHRSQQANPLAFTHPQSYRSVPQWTKPEARLQHSYFL